MKLETWESNMSINVKEASKEKRDVENQPKLLETAFSCKPTL